MMRGIFFICCFCIGVDAMGQSPFLKSEYWKQQALKDVLPHWTNKAVDPVNGMFYTNLDREWKHFGSYDQSPAMIARHLFAYSAGYLMSGDTNLLTRAKQLLAYLDDKAWDKKFGGWYDMLDREGKPAKETKTTFNQVYCITGLTMYYFVTRDPTVLEKIERANGLLEQKVWDHREGGYFDVMKRDWRVEVSNKSFSSEITPVSGYLFYLYLATHEKKYLDQIVRIMDIVAAKMADPKDGWILESFDNRWKYIYPTGGISEINIGHNIETAWMYLRLYLLTKDAAHLQAAEKLWSKIEQHGFNKENGCWYANVSRINPADHPDLSYWWIQAYGNMINLVWYAIDGRQDRLDNFVRGAEFWDKYFVDREFGDVYQGVTASGEMLDSVKANFYKASYHNLENALLCWLYLKLWVEKKEPQLHFSLVPGADLQHLLPVEKK